MTRPCPHAVSAGSTLVREPDPRQLLKILHVTTKTWRGQQIKHLLKTMKSPYLCKDIVASFL